MDKNKHKFSLLKTPEPVTPANLGEALQQAIEIEISTIPTYLYTYYSINRSPDQGAIAASIKKGLINNGKSFKEAEDIATLCSALVMVFSNMAGAIIMSVAIEEMLHMALASNMKQALSGLPELAGLSPDFPADLPGHNPPLKINLAGLSQEQLKTFIAIESPYPQQALNNANAETIYYHTIGEFYNLIKQCIDNPANKLDYNTERPQLAPGRGYYAQNNIDTLYYDLQHKPVFVNAEENDHSEVVGADGKKVVGDLVVVHDTGSADHAIDIIIDQGEGSKIPGLTAEGKPDTSSFGEIIPGTVANDATYFIQKAEEFIKKIAEEKERRERIKLPELPHYYKFLEIYHLYDLLSLGFNSLDIGAINVYDYFVQSVPVNPKTAQYPANIQPVSTLINAVYTYIFVMTEACYLKDGNTQYEIFMFGIHKSMIFILNSLCGDIMKLSYEAKDGHGFSHVYNAAPTFENYTFSATSSPKSQLISLFNAAVAEYPAISYLAPRFPVLPDVEL